jgi:AcrR family transcriptional regulator
VDSRTKILNAASYLFLEGGIGALSVRAIAKRAGLSTIGIYSYFDGKQGILDALYVEGFERVAQAMDVSTLDVSPHEKVMQAAQAYLTVADKFGAHYHLIFGELSVGYQPSEKAKLVAEQAFGKLIDLAALFLPQDASLLSKQKQALEIWAIVHGYVGLKNHAVSKLISSVDWNTLALDTVRQHLQAMANRKSK